MIVEADTKINIDLLTSWRIFSDRQYYYVMILYNFHHFSSPFTLPKFNIDPEKWRLEDYFPIGRVTFQGLR